MSRILTHPKKRGRPQRTLIERARTVLWAHSVCVAAKTPMRELESVLGADGHWRGLWVRYHRGTVSPSPERMARIERKFPGTRRYYDCSLWSLIENRDFTCGELREYAQQLSAPLRSAFIDPARPTNGKFWRSSFDPRDSLDEALRLIHDTRFGLDALISILIVVREAELQQDAWLYLAALKTWAWVEDYTQKHPVLRALPYRARDHVVEPLRKITFADLEAAASWKKHVGRYCRWKQTSPRKYDIVDALNNLNLPEDMEEDKT